MIISHSNKFIFIKTRKVVGTSVRDFFEQFLDKNKDFVISHGKKQRGNSWIYTHAKSLEIIEELGEDIWNNYFTFSIVRHPIETLISQYFFQVNHYKKKYKNFYDFLISESAQKNRNYPILYTNGYKDIDYLIRYENLQEDIDILLDKLGLEHKNIELPKRNTQHRKDRRH